MKKLKRILALLLVALTLSLTACGNESKEKTINVEGGGYKSAESAAVAYVEALCQADVDLMLSTFAVETFIENYNQEKDLERKNFYSYVNEGCPLKNEGNYQDGINRYSRVFNLVYDFKKLYFSLISDGEFELTGTKVVKADEIEAFVEEINDPTFDKKITSSKIGRVFTPEMFYEMGMFSNSDSEELYKTYKDSYERNYNYLNCDDITSLAIEFDYDGNEYYLFVDVGCFDGVWYNISTSSVLGIFVGMSTGSGGVMER